MGPESESFVSLEEVGVRSEVQPRSTPCIGSSPGGRSCLGAALPLAQLLLWSAGSVWGSVCAVVERRWEARSGVAAPSLAYTPCYDRFD